MPRRLPTTSTPFATAATASTAKWFRSAIAGDASGDFVAARFADPAPPIRLTRPCDSIPRVMLVDDPVKRVEHDHGLRPGGPGALHSTMSSSSWPQEFRRDTSSRAAARASSKEAARVIPSAVIDRPKGYFPVPASEYLKGGVLDNVRDVCRAVRPQTRPVPAGICRQVAGRSDGTHLTPLRGSKLWQLGLPRAVAADPAALSGVRS